jgi:glycosyltransferase involved in cell wall biosynthesis
VSTPAPGSGGSLVSVVVCTYGRPEGLFRCLRSLRRLDDEQFEVIVVDNAPRAQFEPEEIERFGARHVHEPRQGLDWARNRGIEAARGDVIAFIDDDCEAQSDWLRGLRAALADDRVACATGRVLPAALSLSSQRWFERRYSFDRGPAAHGFGHAVYPTFPGELGTGCNMAFRRALFDRIGPFDPALDMGTPIGGGGDLDIFARLLDAGEIAIYEPKAIVFHHHRDNAPALRKQFWGYGAAAGAMCFKFAVLRPGRRREMLQHYIQMLRECARRGKARLLRRDRYPLTLSIVEAGGIIAGPFLYVLSSRRMRRAYGVGQEVTLRAIARVVRAGRRKRLAQGRPPKPRASGSGGLDRSVKE